MNKGVFALLFVVTLSSAFATPFTFQGRLNNSSTPSTGLHHFKFRLYDAESNGTQIGSEVSKTAVIDGGLFNVSLDFGPDAFDGDARWLDIEVRPDSAPDFTLLTPRQAVSATPYALHSAVASDLKGTAHVLVQTTSSATQNGLNLLSAYAKAKLLTPNGQPLSATNRAVVLVPPGHYDLGTEQIVLDSNFIDLAGLSTSRDNQYIEGASNGWLTSTGVLRQTATDVHISNLKVYCSYSSLEGPITLDPRTSAAYFPDANLAGTVVTNCEFTAYGGNCSFPTRIGVEYSGTYVDCSASGSQAFGTFSIASGTFIRCSAGNSSFGDIASGTFTDCAAGSGSFGVEASGTFVRCKAGNGSFGNQFGTAAGSFTDCVGGKWSFAWAGQASGNFVNCTAGDESFGGKSPTLMNTANTSGTFRNCVGGQYCFGGGGNTTTGAKFYSCTAGPDSFGPGYAVRLLCIQNDTLLP